MVPCRTWFCVRKVESGCWTTVSTLEMHPWVLIAYLGPVLKPTLFFWSWSFLLQVLPLRVVFVQLLSRVNSLWPQGTVSHQAPLSFTISQSLLKLMSICQRCHPTISSSVIPFSSCLHSFPASGSFLMRWLFASGGQSIGASTSAPVLPMNIQGWFPLELTGWISLQSKGLSRVLSSTTVQKHQFFGAQPFLWSNSHIPTWLLEKPWLWLDGRLS